MTCLPGHRERVMEDVREHEAASCIRGYGEDHTLPLQIPQERHSSTLQSSETGQRSYVKIVQYQFYSLRNHFEF